MRTCRFSEEQIARALHQAEAGTPVTEICRKLEIADAGRGCVAPTISSAR